MSIRADPPSQAAGLGAETDATSGMNNPESLHPLGNHERKTDTTVVHGAGAVSASSSSSSTREDENTTATMASKEAPLSSSSLSTENTDAPMPEDARLMIDFLQELSSPMRAPPLKRQPNSNADLPPVPVFEKPPRRTGFIGSSRNQREAAMGRGEPRDEAGEQMMRQLHAPAFLFPSGRKNGSPPPSTTLRITIKNGLVQRPERRREEEDRAASAREEDENYEAEDEEAVAPRPPASMGRSMASAIGNTNNGEPDYDNAADTTGTKTAVQEEGNASYSSDTLEGSARNDSYTATQEATSSSAAAISNTNAPLPLASMKRYPYPDIRPIHSGTFSSPLGGPSSSETQRPARYHDQTAEHDEHRTGGSSSSNNINSHDNLNSDSLSFSMPSRAELAASDMDGMMYATERVWERRDPNRVRRPPNVHPPAEPSSAGGYRRGPGSPPYDNGRRTSNGMVMMGPSGSSSSTAGWDEHGSYSQPPQSFYRGGSSSKKSVPKGFRPGSHQYGGGMRRQHHHHPGPSSSSSMFSSSSSIDSFPSASDLSRNPANGRGNNSNRQQGDGQWDLFQSLVDQAEREQKELQRRERVAEREKNRSYNCDWYRIGYYRKCQEQYGDPRLYDSEDSEYDDPYESGWAEYHNGPIPAPRDYNKVKNRMLQIDDIIKAQFPKPPPKYTAKEWKTARRRDTLRQSKAKKDKYSSYTYLDSDRVFTPPRKKNPEKARSSFGSSSAHKVAKSFKSPPGMQHIRLPGQPPKRQSTALKESYDLEPDGSIKCRRCGKTGFANELGLRSHLSHCPGTIRMKEERAAKEYALYTAMQEAAAESGQLTATQIANVTANVNAQAEAGTLPLVPPPARQHHYASSSLVGDDSGDDTKLPSGPPMYLASQRSFESGSPPVLLMPTVDVGTPLVPGTIQHGEDIVQKTISYRNHLNGWTDVKVLNYRSRRNTHLLQYDDQTTEWVVLGDRNACLEPGYRGDEATDNQGAGSSSSSSNNLNNSNNMGGGNEHDPERSYSSKLAASASSSSNNGGGGGSGDSSDDGQGGPNSKRRSSRFGESSGATLGGGGYDTTTSLGTNDFFKKQEELLSRRNKRKAGDMSEGAGSGDDQRSLSDVSEAGSPCKVLVRMEETVNADGSVRKVMRASPPHRAPQQQHHHHGHHHSHGPPPHGHQQHHMHPSNKSTKTISQYTGMTINNKYQSTASGAPANNSFPCRRCHMLFHNKQSLGWHTRKGCVGPIHPPPHAHSSNAAYGSSSASHVPHEAHNHHGMPSNSSAMAYGSSSSSGKPPSSMQQQHYNKRGYSDMGGDSSEDYDGYNEYVSRKKNRN